MEAYKIIQLNGRHTLVHPRYDLLCDTGSINMLCVKAITQS